MLWWVNHCVLNGTKDCVLCILDLASATVVTKCLNHIGGKIKAQRNIEVYLEWRFDYFLWILQDYTTFCIFAMHHLLHFLYVDLVTVVVPQTLHELGVSWIVSDTKRLFDLHTCLKTWFLGTSANSYNMAWDIVFEVEKRHVLVWQSSWHACIKTAAFLDSKVQGANMGPTWVLLAHDGPHVGPMNLAIRVISSPLSNIFSTSAPRPQLLGKCSQFFTPS